METATEFWLVSITCTVITLVSFQVLLELGPTYYALEFTYSFQCLFKAHEH